MTLFKRFQEELCSSTTTVFIQIKRGLSIRASDILFIERKQNKTYIHTKSCVYETSLSLNSIAKLLPSDNFVRNHRSYIVNINAVTKVNKSDNKVFFDTSTSCPIGNIH